MSSHRSAVFLIARRFLFSQSSDRFLSFIAMVSVAGVALGVLALVVVTSVFNGFTGELKRVITGMNSDVVLYSRGEPIEDIPKIKEKIEKIAPDLKALTPSFITELMISGPLGVSGGVLEGIEFESAALVTTVKEKIVSGVTPKSNQEVALGVDLASRLGAKEGDEVKLIFPGLEGMGEPLVFTSKVVGIIKMGMYDYDSKFIFMTLQAVQQTLNKQGKATAFKIKLPEEVDSQIVADRLAENFGFPFRVKSWTQLNKNVFYAIRLQKVVISILLGAIILVAAFNVISTLMMMIHDKTSEISILKAMGLSASKAFFLFCLIGIGIGVTGIILGILSGLGINELLVHSPWVKLPPDIYYIGFLPVVVRWDEIGWIALISFLITFGATLYPAVQVSVRSPLEGLRYE